MRISDWSSDVCSSDLDDPAQAGRSPHPGRLAGRPALRRRLTPTRKDGAVIADCAVYTDGVRRAGDLAVEDALEASHDPGSFVWIGLPEPSPEEFEAVRHQPGLHELAVEDAVATPQRPQLDGYVSDPFGVPKQSGKPH